MPKINNNDYKKPNSAKSKQLTLLLTLLCLRVTSAGARVRSLLLWPPPVPATCTILPCCWQSNYNPITMSPRVGLWSVCDGWLLVDGARWYGVWVGGLLVVVGRSY